jgi:hypothetical protein
LYFRGNVREKPSFSKKLGFLAMIVAAALILGGCANNVREVVRVSKEAGGALIDQLPAVQSGAVITPTQSAGEPDATSPTAPNEHPVISIPLAPPLNDRSAELSGMAWHGDDLIPLPQFPSRFDNHLYALSKADIAAYLRGESSEPLAVRPIAFDDGALHALLEGFDGFEAIAFDGDRAFLTIESRSSFGMLGVLVAGEMAANGEALALNPFAQASIPVQAALNNMSDETVFVVGDQVVTIYEANGANINPSAVVHRFSQDLKPAGVAPMVNMEYRITDATALDEDGRFWAINYLWPGDADKLRLADDPLAPDRNGINAGESPTPIERLVEFQWLGDEGVALSGEPPINLRLLPGGVSRNWEGIARFQDGELDGFLLVTDEFPSTMLGFVGREE